MNTTFYLHKSNDPDNSGQYMIHIYCTFEGDKSRPSAGIKCHPDNFYSDDKIQYVKSSDPDYKSKNSKLAEYKKFLEGLPDELLTDDYIRVEFKNHKRGTRPDKIKKGEKGFFEFWDDWVEECGDEVSENTSRKLSPRTIKLYKGTKEMLKAFEIHSLYRLSALTLNHVFYKKFRKYVLTERPNDKIKESPGVQKKGLGVSTFSHHIKNIKKFAAWYQDIDSRVNNNFRKWKKYKAKAIVQPLRPEELILLYNHRSEKPHLERARLIFLTLCSTSLRISDYNKLEPNSQLINGLLQMEYHSQKTTGQYMIPYFDDLYFRPVDCVNQLIEKFGSIPRVHGQNLNELLIDLFREAEIFRIRPTSKTGRKTFATLKLLFGVNPEIIMKIGGWKTRAAFDDYVGIDTYNILKEVMEKAKYAEETNIYDIVKEVMKNAKLTAA